MAHLIIANGELQGKELNILEGGMRIGRAKSNDFVIDDERLSQFHCRFFFKSDGHLWVTDFGSTNETLVNNRAVSEQRLGVGDLVDIGGIIFKILRAEKDDVSQNRASAGDLPQEKSGEVSMPQKEVVSHSGGVDLGFKRSSGEETKSLLLRVGWALAILMVIIMLALALMRFTGDQGDGGGKVALPKNLPLTIDYEKVEADSKNIFRYALRLEENMLSIQIDDLKNNRHVSREKKINESIVAQLRDQVKNSQFFYLQPSYAGVSPGIYELKSLSVTLGNKTSHTKVFNRLEPRDFKTVRELIEDFGKTELGLAALALSPERLEELASDSFLMGRKSFEEREVRYENLSTAIKHFTLAQWYLETLEPKPDFYRQAVSGLEMARKALEERYKDYIFRADRAVTLGDWEEAAENLRIILKLIPDRADERHSKARKQLLTVERHL